MSCFSIFCYFERESAWCSGDGIPHVPLFFSLFYLFLTLLELVFEFCVVFSKTDLVPRGLPLLWRCCSGSVYQQGSLLSGGFLVFSCCRLLAFCLRRWDVARWNETPSLWLVTW